VVKEETDEKERKGKENKNEAPNSHFSLRQ